MIKKFHAQNTRDALRQVRDALGASAIILSNRQVAGGIEIIAVADMDMAALTAQAEPALWAAAKNPRPAPAAQAIPAPRAAAVPEEARPQLASLAEYLTRKEEASLIRPSPARAAHPPVPGNGTPAPADAPPASPSGVQELAREVRLLRGLVEGQLAGFAWNDLTRRDPLRAEAMKRLLAAGFSPAFARQLLDRLPDRCQADAQLGRDIGNLQPLTGTENVSQDRLPERLIHLVRRALVVDPGKLHGRHLSGYMVPSSLKT